MGWWSERALPRILDRGMRGEQFRELRGRCLAGLEGRVLELGFGSGLNLPHYPVGVTEILALEPNALARRLAASRIAEVAPRVELLERRAESIALADASVDAVVSTWTLCTIEDAAAALAQVRRVLRPGGRLHFVEHGLAPDPRVARWQRRLTPLQRRLGGGCRLDRPIAELVRAAGFELEELATFFARGPRPYVWTYLGRAAPARSGASTGAPLGAPANAIPLSAD